ncbi:MAG: UdgX family uracil-DNA binding protein [Pseudolabrys sp.]
MPAAPSSDEVTPDIRSLRKLREAEAACTRCPLYRNATQVVPGEGPAHAPLMLVGEQPGDREDLAGHPFVGPAGQMLDRAIAEAGIARKQVFVTNAVKHFKFVPRGKRRLHQKPNAHEIDRCKWWNDFERSLVKPRLIAALGATAGRSLFGRTVTIGKMRGRVHHLDDGTAAIITTHPSALLRMPDA